MEENIIKLKKRNTLRFGIKTYDGKDTNNFIEFDLDDIELPLRLQECEMKHKKNIDYIKMQFAIIEKQQDRKGKYALSVNEEKKFKVIKEFYKREMEALDLFLGKDGCKKLLNGSNPYYEMYDDFAEMLAPILPKLKLTADDMAQKIRDKYKKMTVESNILE